MEYAVDVLECSIVGSQSKKNTQSVFAEENVIVLLDTDAIAVLIPGIPVDSGVTGPDMLDAHPECTVEGEVAIGWSTTSNNGARRFRKRMKITEKTTARIIPPVTPPAMAGVLDLREDVEGGDDAEGEDGVGEARVEEIMGEGVGVGVATINSGLSKDNEALHINWQEGILALYGDG
jgi:hypothetical protein